MPKYVDVKLLDKMEDAAYDLCGLASDLEMDLARAIDMHETCADVEDARSAVSYDKVVRKTLKKFDAQLAQLILLRGQLADATGIPIDLNTGRHLPLEELVM